MQRTCGSGLTLVKPDQFRHDLIRVISSRATIFANLVRVDDHTLLLRTMRTFSPNDIPFHVFLFSYFLFQFLTNFHWKMHTSIRQIPTSEGDLDSGSDMSIVVSLFPLGGS